MKCEVCGNEYEKTMEIRQGGEVHTFDSFECAIHAMAPRCANCGVTVVGHGVQHGSETFCGAHCAKSQGAEAARDRL